MEYKLAKSKRKTIELSIGDDLVPSIKAPYGMSKNDIDDFVQKHILWIQKHIDKKRLQIEKTVVTAEKETIIKSEALPYLTERTEYYAGLMGLKPSGVKITSAKKRFGSCSGKNSICYSWRLMLYPPKAIDYVVVHELAHILHKNHGAEFYRLIEKYLPDYREREELLK